eukprot:scaffold86431_cov69-Phaeocystis_antarctica.AAC.4
MEPRSKPCVVDAGEAALPQPRDCPQALGDTLEPRCSLARFHPLAGAPATRRDAVGCAASGRADRTRGWCEL